MSSASSDMDSSVAWARSLFEISLYSEYLERYNVAVDAKGRPANLPFQDNDISYI